MQHPIESVADAQFLFVRFNVNVRRFLADCIHQDLVNKAHHGCIHFCRVGIGRGCGFGRHILKTGVFAEIRKL